MDTNKLMILANKLHKRFVFQNAYDLLRELKQNKFIKDLLKQPEDLLKFVFYVHLLNQGYKSEEITNLVDDNLFGIKIIEISQNNPSIDCDDCDGNGQIGCDSCYGEGNIDCRTCDGDGEESCPDCGGDGEIDGEPCDECQGNGNVSCSDCGGGGNEDCSSCGGDGNYDCDSCDGEGHINADGQQEFEIFYLVSLNKKLESQLIVEEYPLKISEDTFSKIKSDKLTVIVSFMTDVSDEFYDDFNEGDIFVDSIDEPSPETLIRYSRKIR